MQVTIERDRGRKLLAARFGGIPLTRQRTAVLTDKRPVMASTRRNELIHRLLAGRGATLHPFADELPPGTDWVDFVRSADRATTAFVCRLPAGQLSR